MISVDPSKQRSASLGETVYVDRARRAAAARAIAAVFVVLSLLAIAVLLGFVFSTPALIVQSIGALAYVVIWWIARKPERATTAGGLLVATQLSVEVASSAFLSAPIQLVHVAYHTALSPLIAAATLPSRGVAATGAAGVVALGLQLLLNERPGIGEDFLSPTMFFLGAWVIATASSMASGAALRGHERQERRAQVAQDAARLAEARYDLITERVSELVSVLDADGRYLYASPSYSRVLGVEPEELVGRSPELVHPDDEALLVEGVGRARRGETASVVARLRHKDGRYRWFHVAMSDVSGLAGATRQGEVAQSLRDVTEQRELSEELEKTRRMEALGNLAGGVAHDFNNLLMVVQSCVDLATMHLPDEHPARADLATVGETVKRAAGLTQQLVTFASRQVLPPTDGSVPARVTSEIAPILRRWGGKSVELQLDTRGSTRAVDASSVQVEQLLMNLCSNAFHAMPDGGTLKVEVADRELGPGELDGALSPGSYVQLRVSDTGVGMTPEVQERIFEPFFTTKSAGRGTGLGLATVFGLVSQLQGHITVRSAPGVGSAFTILLPSSRPDEESSVAESAAESLPHLLSVLVIDDEAPVRASVAHMLDQVGHRVTEASSIEGALALLTEPTTTFDAIVTDLVLGAGDGELVEQLRSARPNAIVVVMSGASPDPQRADALAEQGAEFLPKPFSSEGLLGVLDRATRRAR